jgi:hypothetical protein
LAVDVSLGGSSLAYRPMMPVNVTSKAEERKKKKREIPDGSRE